MISNLEGKIQRRNHRVRQKPQRKLYYGWVLIIPTNLPHLRARLKKDTLIV